MFISLISSIHTHHYFVILTHRDFDNFYDHVNHMDRLDHDDYIDRVNHIDHVAHVDRIENRFLGEDCCRSSSRRQRSEAGEEVEH